jgi:hypothetical protein
MATEKVRVRSTDGAVGVPFRTSDGTLVMGRWFGQSARGVAIEGGEVVEVGSGNRTDLVHGVADGHITFTAEE